MPKPILAVGYLTFDENHGNVICQYAQRDAERAEMDYLDFIARFTTHTPHKGQVMVRYYAVYSNAHWGRLRKQGQALSVMPMPGPPPAGTTSPGWRQLLERHTGKPAVPPPSGRPH